MKHSSNIHAVTDSESTSDAPYPASRRRLRRIRSMAGELRQRKVSRAAITYILIMWLNLQVADVLFPMLGFPDWTLKFVMLVGVMGFPVVLILAWMFQITANGIVLDEQGDRSQETAAERRMDQAVNLILLSLSMIFVVLLAIRFLDTGKMHDLAVNDQPPVTELNVLP